MRPLWKDILAAIWLGMILPGIVLNIFLLKEKRHELQIVQSLQMKEVVSSGKQIPVRDPEAVRSYMDLDEYLTGVLLAEMPAQFHEAALKAQSVAARTYTWKAYTTGGKHGDGSVCTDASCCQSYMSEESYLARGGTDESLEKVRNAVKATSPFVLLYGNELIEATYFSSSGGSTEAALAVWGTDYPYLQAVSSQEAEYHADSVVYSVEEFQRILGKTCSEASTAWFGHVTYTEGGGVETMEICGEIYTGVALRSLLKLRSTAFEIEANEESIVITTKGYGHRVGLSQYGADAMAQAGSTWQEILQHYYPGTTLVPIP